MRRTSEEIPPLLLVLRTCNSRVIYHRDGKRVHLTKERGGRRVQISCTGSRSHVTVSVPNEVSGRPGGWSRDTTGLSVVPVASDLPSVRGQLSGTEVKEKEFYQNNDW